MSGSGKIWASLADPEILLFLFRKQYSHWQKVESHANAILVRFFAFEKDWLDLLLMVLV